MKRDPFAIVFAINMKIGLVSLLCFLILRHRNPHQELFFLPHLTLSPTERLTPQTIRGSPRPWWPAGLVYIPKVPTGNAGGTGFQMTKRITSVKPPREGRMSTHLTLPRPILVLLRFPWYLFVLQMWKCLLWVKPYVNAASLPDKKKKNPVTLCFIVQKVALAVRTGRFWI